MFHFLLPKRYATANNPAIANITSNPSIPFFSGVGITVTVAVGDGVEVGVGVRGTGVTGGVGVGEGVGVRVGVSGGVCTFVASHKIGGETEISEALLRPKPPFPIRCQVPVALVEDVNTPKVSFFTMCGLEDG